jgi:hypothetical protein
VVGDGILAARERQLLDVDLPRVGEFDVTRQQVRCCVHHRLGIAKDERPTVCSLGGIASLSVSSKVRVVGIDKCALQ